MIFQKIIVPLLFYVFILNIFSCDSTSNHSEKIRPAKKGLNEFETIFVNMKSAADKLVFKRYYLNPDSNITRDFASVIWADSTTEQKKIGRFNRLFTGIENRGYCCCIITHYTVSFYQNNKELGLYCVDTSSLKGIASFFDQSYQTSYCIDLNVWNSYLREN